MIYDTSIENQAYLFKKQNEWIIENKKTVEQKIIQKNRSLTQNNALHLFFEHISTQLNEMGNTFHYTGLKGVEIECRYTGNLVKEMIWRPIQITLFDKESTTKLNTNEMNEIITILNKFFADRGVYLPFPSIESMIEFYEPKH